MNNMKIKVNTESESREVQELFFELGYNWFKKGYMEVKTPETIMSFENGALSTGIRGSINHKEITLPELRDLVVLKRNDVGDASHINCNGQYMYEASSGDWYLYHNNAWKSDGVDIDDMPKPIEKPMKEYLRKNSNGTHSYIGTVRPEHVSDFMIEIPKWANFAAFNQALNNYYFSKADVYVSDYVIWQRRTPPEELPFIDDEPSINDQYAEIEKVRQTLKTRQDQYGSFEDVAMFTEQMVDVMRKGYYEKLAYNQKMALYMICSKMARIVNGNPNHKDSWHDIAGYATLIDNELESEKDMPF